MTLCLIDLPVEILKLIVGHLNMFDREAVARTMNRKLYEIAQPGLDIAWMHHARRVVARFNQDYKCEPHAFQSSHFWPIEWTTAEAQPSFPSHLPVFPFGRIKGFYCQLPRGITILPEKCFPLYDLDPSQAPYIRQSPVYLKDCLSLDGSFSWLQVRVNAPDEVGYHAYDHEKDEISKTPMMTEKELSQLRAQTEDLGLALPVGFEKFVRDLQLRQRVEELDCWGLFIGKLVKCPASVDKGAGGYLLSFYGDIQGCGYVSIYFDPGGSHCVLGSAYEAASCWHMDELDDVTQASEEIRGSITTIDKSYEKQADLDGIDDDCQCWDSLYITGVKRLIAEGRITRAEFESAKADGLQLCLNTERKYYMLHAFSFEEFLAIIYFESCIVIGPVKEPGVEKYVARAFAPLPKKA